MPKFFHSLLVCLAIMAVVMIQAAGVRSGYRCGCTGEQSAEAECATDTCHPQIAHSDGCDDHGADHACEASDHHCPKPPQNDHKHNHEAVSEQLEVTTFVHSILLPPVMCFAVPATLLWQEMLVLTMEAQAAALRPRPPDDTGQPMVLIVVETTELLV